MFPSTVKLLETADVLEKVAYYFEDEEKKTLEKQAKELESQYIDPIRESIRDMKPELAEKLAHADPEILELLKSVSVNTTADDGTLGGPTEKVASDGSDDPLLAFCVADD
jgi:hypothetical protein